MLDKDIGISKASRPDILFSIKVYSFISGYDDTRELCREERILYERNQRNKMGYGKVIKL